MPLVYRDVRQPRPDAFRRPSWIPPSASLERVQHDDGDLVGQWDPLVFQPGELLKDRATVWHDVGEDWRLAVVGDLEPRRHLRTDPGRPALIPVSDGLGRAWHTPAVLTATGACALSLALGKGPDGQWTRLPTPEQAALIAAARFIRTEVETMVVTPDQEEISRFSTLPIGPAADTVATLYQAIYVFSPAVLAVLGVLDDVLMRQSMLSSAGFVMQARKD